MNISLKNVSKEFEGKLKSFGSKENGIEFLVNQVNLHLKKSRYEQSHLILEYARLKFMKRKSLELSNDEKKQIIKIQLQKAVIFMAQKNKGATGLMISIADNIKKNLGAKSLMMEQLKRISQNENAQQIALSAIRDERFTLNNLNQVVMLLMEKAALVQTSGNPTSVNLEKQQELTLEIKAYQTGNN